MRVRLARGVFCVAAGLLSVAPAHAGNLLRNPTFEDGPDPFLVTFVPPASGSAMVEGGALCVTVTAVGNEPWDVTLRQRSIGVQKGHAYALSLSARSNLPTRAKAVVRRVGPPYDVYFQKDLALGGEEQKTSASFSADVDDPGAELAIHLGGPLAGKPPFKVCLRDPSLDDPKYTAPAPPPKVIVPDVIVDPLGYFPHGKKRAMVKSTAAAPIDWKLVGPDETAPMLASGKTTVFGLDAASGDTLHQVDFSAHQKEGKGLTLVVGVSKSASFEIGAPYGKLSRDALAYFFHNRSGVEIPASLVGDTWARKAGHPSDSKVSCLNKTCDYELDVHGGWYDAGDHGKYVVNGGIATWMLMMLYERTQHLGGSLDALGDGKLQIPESKNEVPDLLDEVRFELEFLLRMQVPQGKPLAGMAHHKVHDAKWTPIPTRPDEDPEPRFLHPPSTAATLNLAAVAAQAARVFKSFDAAFASKCLEAAERAWTAATKEPPKYAPPEDTVGGGAYEDADVTDETYWAAVELYLTTQKPAYLTVAKASKHWLSVPTTPAGMDWKTTQALGTISLAVVPSAPKVDAETARANLKSVAEGYLAIIAKEGYRSPLRAGPLPWGSNSLVLDDAVILALAYDFTKDVRFLDGVRDAMSYIVGRNPNAQTYVTGYGVNPLRNPHHRFWAQQKDASFPPAPPGAVSGGPNSGLEDPYAKGLRIGCAPMKCFVDHIESYSTNEVAINWNAPLAYVATFLDEMVSK